MESWVQTFDNSKYCLYFAIPSFLQFLNCNSQINVSLKHVSCFDKFLLQVCLYLKLNTCLWSCKNKWFNLELEPKMTFKGNQGCPISLEIALWWLNLLFNTKQSQTVYKSQKQLFKKFILKIHYLLVTCGPRKKKNTKTSLLRTTYSFKYLEPPALDSECQPLQSLRLIWLEKSESQKSLPFCQCNRALARLMFNVISF